MYARVETGLKLDLTFGEAERQAGVVGAGHRADICGFGRDGEVTLKGSVPDGSALVGQGQKLCVQQMQAFFLGSLAFNAPRQQTIADYNDRNRLTAD